MGNLATRRVNKIAVLLDNGRNFVIITSKTDSTVRFTIVTGVLV